MPTSPQSSSPTGENINSPASSRGRGFFTNTVTPQRQGEVNQLNTYSFGCIGVGTGGFGWRSPF